MIRERGYWGMPSSPPSAPVDTSAVEPASSLTGYALAIASEGLPVFPCKGDKKPIVEGGFKSATRDPAAIRDIFTRPGAALIAVPTGRVSRLVVIDIDPRHGGETWLAENRDAIPPTRTHGTPSGGRHLVFRDPLDVEIRNSQGRIAPGIDVRGTGGYAIVPPSKGYSVAHNGALADMPPWLISACLKPGPPPRAPSGPHRPPLSGDGSPYGLKALSEECTAIRHARFGQQEATLNNAALKIGSLVAADELRESYALTELIAAGNAMPSESAREPWRAAEIEKKVRHGVEDGKRTPREVPPSDQANEKAKPSSEPTPDGDEAAPPPLNNETEVSDAETEKEIARLAKLPRLRYARERHAAAKLLNLNVTIIDLLVKAERGDGGNGRLQGRPLDLPRPEPWPTPVDGVQLFTELVEFFSEHAKLPERGEVMLPLWVVHTYCYELWRYTPRAHITGPTKRCGKSRVLRLVGLLACKPVPSSRISAAAVYRSIEAAHPTLLIDEADLSVKNNPELLLVLNGGYERGQNVLIAVGEEHEPRLFDLFAPNALAGIGRLAGTLEDRSIRLPMRRALPAEKPTKITQASEARAERLQRQIARWVADNRQALATAAPDVSHLPDRVDDHWFPLYAIASVVGDNWPLLVEAAQKALTPTDHDTDSLGEKLVRDIRALWVEEKKPTTGEIGSTALVDHLTGLPSGEWLELGKLRKPLSTTRLATLLKGFEVKPTRSRHANTGCYLWRDIAPLFERYA